MHAAHFALHQANAVHVEKVSYRLDIAIAQALAFVSETDGRKGTAEDSRHQVVGIATQAKHLLQQGRISDPRIASGVLAVLGAFGEHEMIAPADLISGVP